jgi:hypothetical protein
MAGDSVLSGVNQETSRKLEHRIRAIAQQPPNDRGRSRIKQKSKTEFKTVQGREKDKSQSRVPVTA